MQSACLLPTSDVALSMKEHDCNEVPHRIDPGLEHISTSLECPKWREEKAVAEYRRNNQADYRTAKAAVKQTLSSTYHSRVPPGNSFRKEANPNDM